MLNKFGWLLTVYWLPDTAKRDAVVTKNFLRSLAIAAVACSGASAAHAQTVLQLSYPANAPAAAPCIYTTNAAGISADPQSGNLLATGDFTTGCPQTGSALPLPVIVPAPSDWVLPISWAIGEVVGVQWAAPNATSCTYGGSFANGWPAGGNACDNLGTCQTLHNVSLSPPGIGQYQFSLTCSNTTGSVTSTSPARTVVASPPVITAGPSTWSVLPWTSGQTRQVQWSASNANNCNFAATALPNGVTLGQFLSGTSTCSNSGSCAGPNSLTLNAPVPGQYGLTMTCTNTNGGSATSSNSWTVSQSSSSNCLNPAPGWNRVESANVAKDEVWNGSIGPRDVTIFESVWGRDYSIPGGQSANWPIITQWPGVKNARAGAQIGFQEYLALKFRTPSGAAVRGNNFVMDGTSFSVSGGGVGTIARVSMTISKVCGDFDTGSNNIPPVCYRSQMLPNDEFPVFTNSGVFGNPPSCSLQPNTDYYLNIILAPLTSPASAVFNGVEGPGIILFQNNGVQ